MNKYRLKQIEAILLHSGNFAAEIGQLSRGMSIDWGTLTLESEDERYALADAIDDGRQTWRKVEVTGSLSFDGHDSNGNFFSFRDYGYFVRPADGFGCAYMSCDEFDSKYEEIEE